MKYLLIKASIDYADEFECEMFGAFPEKAWNDLCKKTKKFFGEKKCEIECFFGTNEYLCFNSYKEWFDSFAISEITENEFNFLIKTFDLGSGSENGIIFGTGSRAFYISFQDEDF